MRVITRKKSLSGMRLISCFSSFPMGFCEGRAEVHVRAEGDRERKKLNLSTDFGLERSYKSKSMIMNSL